MGLQARPLKNFGADVTGLDLSKEVPEATQKELYDLWLQHGVLRFRGIGNSNVQHLRLARCFGPLQQHPVKSLRLAEDPDLIYLGGEDRNGGPMQYVNEDPRYGFIYWHQDMAYVPEINKGSVLRMINKPATGGETCWVDTAAAYDDLPQYTKDRIERLEMVQATRAVPEHNWGMPGTSVREATTDEQGWQFNPVSFPLVAQPIVISHPEVNRKSLLLSPLGYVRIIGLSQDEGDALYEELTAHTLQEKYRFLQEWELNDMIVWDNRRTMHCAFGYPPDEQRLVYRATLQEAQLTGRLYNEAAH